MKRRSFLGAAGSLALSAAAAPNAAANAEAGNALQAWTGATLWSGEGRTFQESLVVVNGERIVHAGAVGPIPQGAVVHDARGTTITPGWVACEMALGLTEIEAESSTVDSVVAQGAPSERIRAAHSAADGYNPRSSLLGVALRAGITNAVATPTGGLVSGTSSWFDILPALSSEPLIEEHVALHAHVFSNDWGSRPQGLSLLRQALEKARLYIRAPRSYNEGRTRALGLSPENLKRLAECFEGRPLVVRVSRAADILRILALAKTYSLKLVLSGAQEGALVADQIAQSGAAVVLNVLDNLPTSFATLYSRRDNATRLVAAGVPIVFSSFDAHQAQILSQIAGNAVAAGLSQQDALRALTSQPAQVFGMSKDYGSLVPGKVANFCLWTGDPFELSNWARSVVVRGHAATPYSRQNALFERYRKLIDVPHGRAGGPS